MHTNNQHQEPDKNSRLRGERRAVRRDSQGRDTMRSRRGRERHLSVRSELRDKPDVSKIARAVIRMTLAQAEADAAREATRRADPDNPNHSQDDRDD
jgi:hypothetical protein